MTQWITTVLVEQALAKKRSNLFIYVSQIGMWNSEWKFFWKGESSNRFSEAKFNKKVLKKVKIFVLPKNAQKITLNGKKKSFSKNIFCIFSEKLYWKLSKKNYLEKLFKLNFRNNFPKKFPEEHSWKNHTDKFTEKKTVSKNFLEKLCQQKC